MSDVVKMSEKERLYAESVVELGKMQSFLVYKQIADDVVSSLIKKVLRSKLDDSGFSMNTAEIIGQIRGISLLFKTCDDLVALYKEETKSKDLDPVKE